MAPLLIALVLIGGGTSFAAKSALPGSALYPVKVDFNEKLQSSLEFSSAGKADWDATLESRRLSEAETLASQGKLTASTEADLKTRFDATAQDYATQVAAITATGKGSAAAVSTSSKLQGSLAAHAQVLASMDGSADGAQVADLLASVTAQSSTVAQSQNSLEAAYTADASANTQASAQNSETSAQGAISSASSLVTSVNANGSADAIASANANIALANQAYQEGMTSYSAGNYGDAFIQFQNAMRIANQTQTSLTIGQNLNLSAVGTGINGTATMSGQTSGSTSSGTPNSSGGSTSSSSSGSFDTSVGASGSSTSSGTSVSGSTGVNVNAGGGVNVNVGQ